MGPVQEVNKNENITSVSELPEKFDKFVEFVNNIYLNGEIEIEHGLLKRKTPISSDGQVVFETEKLNEISENETEESNSEEEPEEEPMSETQSATDNENLEEYRQSFFMNGETSSDD